MSNYILGVIFAALSGILNNWGTLLQKKVVNSIPVEERESGFMKKLIKSPTWIFGLVLGVGIGSVFFMVAQLYIGPAIIPGLMGAGLIVLAIGSVKINNEQLKKSEYSGIVLMVLGIVFIGLSELVIEESDIDLTDSGLIIRISIFTIISFLISLISMISKKSKMKYTGHILSIGSGFQFVLTNFWIYPLLLTIGKTFGGTATSLEIIYFIISSLILTIANIYGLVLISEAFKFGQASNLIPIQQIPIQICPILAYYFIFFLPTPSTIALVFIIIGVSLVIGSGFLLGSRQASIDNM